MPVRRILSIRRHESSGLSSFRLWRPGKEHCGGVDMGSDYHEQVCFCSAMMSNRYLYLYIYIYMSILKSLLIFFHYIRSIEFHPLISDLEFYDNRPTQPGSSRSLLRTTQAPTKNRGDCVCKQGNFLHWNTKVHRCGWSWKNRATIVAIVW